MNREAYTSSNFDINPELIDLPGTGYSPEADIKRFVRDFEFNIEIGMSYEESIREATSPIVENIRGYWREYLVQLPAFPIPIEFKIVGSEKYVIAPKYNNDLLINTVSEDERNGAVFASTWKTVEILKEAPPGSMVFWLSPPGRAGWYKDGEEVEYPDAQMYVYYVDQEGKLDAVTIVIDKNLSECKKLLEHFGKRGFSNEEQAVRQVVYLDGNDKDYTYDFLVQELEKFWGKGIGNGKTTDDLKNLIRNREDLAFCDKQSEEAIEKFMYWVNQNLYEITSETLYSLKVQIAKTILTLTDYMFGKGERVDFYRAHQRMQAIPGCAGGGARRIKSATESWRKGICIRCGQYKKVGQCRICIDCEEFFSEN